MIIQGGTTGLRPARIVTEQDEDGVTILKLQSLKGADSILIEVDPNQSQIVIDKMAIEPGETTFLFGGEKIRIPYLFQGEKGLRIEAPGVRVFGPDAEFSEEWLEDWKKQWEERQGLNEDWIREWKEKGWGLKYYEAKEWEEFLEKQLKLGKIDEERFGEIFRWRNLGLNGKMDTPAESRVYFGDGFNYVFRGYSDETLEEEMMRDGLIREGENYSYELTPDYFKLDGKKLPDGLHEKYLKLYEKIYQAPLSGKSKVSVRKRNEQ